MIAAAAVRPTAPAVVAVPVRAPAVAAPVRPLSLALISDDFLPAITGVGVHVQCIAEELAKRGHRVTVVTTRRKGEPDFEIWRGVRVHRVFTITVHGFPQALPSKATLRRIFAEERPDLVHYHYLGVMLKRARRVAAELKLPNVYTYHMTADHLTQPWFMRPFRKIIAKQITKFCNGCDLVMAPSANLLEQVRRDGVAVRGRYLSNPLVFKRRIAARPAEKHGRFVVFYAGRLEPEKNLPYLLRAFALFRQKHPDAELWLAGKGSCERALKNQCAESGLTAHVRFLGFLDHAQLAERYAAADVFVLPSLVETQGMVAMEAMHFSRPVIVADSVVSARELVADGRNGFIADHRSAADLAVKLAVLKERPALRREMGRQSRLMSAAYNPARVVDALVEEYRRVQRAE
jgi:glycosyltransferase involved in cell wall biosynthesis